MGRIGRTVLTAALGLLWACGPLPDRPGAPAGPDLEAGFRDPPKDARPSTYWVWLNGHLDRPHAERELEAMRDAGIRGVCIFDMGARGKPGTVPPAGPPFMSDASTEDIAHAVRTAGRLGMDAQLSVASSWDMGGDWVEPRHAVKGLYSAEIEVEGPGPVDRLLPLPPLPAGAPRRPDGSPSFLSEVAVLAVPAKRRQPGYDFVFRLDPPGGRILEHAVLTNTPGDPPFFVKKFSIAVSDTTPDEGAFREVLRSEMAPASGPQRFALPPVRARFARLRLLDGHAPDSGRLQLGEFALYDAQGVNVAGSHAADRTRDGAELLGYPPALGRDGPWSAANLHDGRPGGPGGSWSSPGAPPLRIGDPGEVLDLGDCMDPAGRLRWNAPPGRWAVIRYVCGNTGERLKIPSPNSDGLATDHFSAEATRAFLTPLVERLRARLGPLGAGALKQLYLASYEVRGMVWTSDFLVQFRRARGYDLKPFLPVLSGAVVGDDETTRRFIYDFRKTQGELLVNAYYRTAVDVARAAGLGIESEAGGPGPPIHQVPVDALQALGAVDEVRGEFWPRRPEAHRLWVVKETASAAHAYGKRRVHMEAFTSTNHWQDGPFDLKPSADRAFCEGANHFVWHTAAHQPPAAGRPGWVYGAGTHLGPNLVWWPQAAAFLDYLARGSFLLQQGAFVGDVCYYYGDQGYNFVPPKHVDPSLGFGYDYDVIGPDTLLRTLEMRDGRLAIPGGPSYALLVLPERDDIDPDVLSAIERLVREGAVVCGPRPVKATGLGDRRRRDEEVVRIAGRLWGPSDGTAILEHRTGRGRVVWGRRLREVLGEAGIGPDVDVEDARLRGKLDFIHRRAGETEIYFVRNTTSEAVEGDLVFRAAGRVPRRWDPATGRVAPQPVLRETAAGVAVRLRLESHGATFLVFEAGRPGLRAPVRASSAEAVSESVLRVDGWDGGRIEATAFESGRFAFSDAAGRRIEVEAAPLPAPVDLGGPWELRLPGEERLGGLRFRDGPAAWTDRPEPEARGYSGIGEYRRVFELPASWLAEGRRVFLDLGSLWAVGEAALNGRSLGVLWKPPYAADLTEAARPGRNELVVKVANTWSNRLAGDARLPEAERRTRTNITHSGTAPWKDMPFLRSGLFGPVRLLPAARITAELDRSPDSKPSGGPRSR